MSKMENDQIPGPSMSSTTIGMICSNLNMGDYSTLTVNVTDHPKKSPEADAIWFDIQDPVKSFHGREKFLERLHSSIQEGGVTVLSKLKIIGGLGGVGKTETARKYIQQIKHPDENFVWINAETKDSMTNSFNRLVIQLYHNRKDEMKGKPIKDIVNECYKIICRRKSLVVFDNAQFYRDSKIKNDNGIEPFMPKSLEPNWKLPFFLITSRNLDWVSLTPQLLELGMLEEDECVDFIKKELPSKMEVNEDDARKLGHVLGGLPLALTQAVAYIREEYETKDSGGFTFTLSDYLTVFDQKQKKLLEKLPPDSETEARVMTTWAVTLELVETFKNGNLAIWLSHVLSILSPNGVPLSFMRKIVELKIKESKFCKAMHILRRYAFVAYSDDRRSVNMHRLVQFIIREDLQIEGKLEQLLDVLVGPCNELLRQEKYDFYGPKVAETTNILCILDKLRLVTLKSEFVLFKMQLVRVYRSNFMFDKALALITEIDKTLGPKTNKTIVFITRLEFAVLLYFQMKYEEFTSILKSIYDLLPNHLEPDDPDEPGITDMRVTACLLASQGKRQEALELKNKICKEKLKFWWSSNLHLLQSLSDLSFMVTIHKVYNQPDKLIDRALEYGMEIQNCEICTEANSIEILHTLADIRQFRGRTKEALKTFSGWYDEKEKILPADEPALFEAAAHIFRLTDFTGRSSDLVDMSKTLYERLMTIKRPYHSRALTTISNFAYILDICELHQESLNVFGRLCEDGELVWGPYDFRVLQVMEKKAQLLQSQGRDEEAVIVLKKVNERKCKNLQLHGPILLADKRYIIGLALINRGQYEEALKIFEVVRSIREREFGPTESLLLKTLEKMSDVLWRLGRFDESIVILQDLLGRCTNEMDRNGPFQMGLDDKRTMEVKEKLSKRQENLNLIERKSSKPLCESDDGIGPFMPRALEPNWKRLSFLITTRNVDWDSLTSQVLQLDMFEVDECLEFITKELSPSLKVNEGNARELGRVLGRLPLALTQAVAYIRENCRKKQLSRSTFTISDYLKEFDQMQEKLLKNSPGDSKTYANVMTTWSVSLNLIKTFDNGDSAIWLSQILSILSPDGVPVIFLLKIVKEKLSHDEFCEAMDILHRYAFVKYSDEKTSVSMHRLVQLIIREDLQKKGELEQLLDVLVVPCRELLPRSRNQFQHPTAVEITNILCVLDKLRSVTPKSELLFLQIQLSRECRREYMYKLGHALITDKILGQTTSQTILCMAKLENALVLRDQRKYEEFASRLKDVCDLLPKHLEPDDSDVSSLTDLRVKACILASEGKRQEALELKNRICKKMLEFWRSGNLHLLQTLIDLEDTGRSHRVYNQQDQLLERALKHGMEIQNCEICTEANSIEILECMSNIHEIQGRNEKALDLYKGWYDEKEKVLPADETALIEALHHMVRLADLKVKSSEIFADMSKILHEKLMTIKRPYHPRVLNAMLGFFCSLGSNKMYEESLDVLRRMCEDGEVAWGPYDSRVLWAMKVEAELLQSQDRHEEAVHVLEKLRERRKKNFKQYGPLEVARARYNTACRLSKCGEFKQSLDIFEGVLETQKEILSPTDSWLLRTMECTSDALWSLERFDESIVILQDLLGRWTNEWELGDEETVEIHEKIVKRQEHLLQYLRKVGLTTNSGRMRNPGRLNCPARIRQALLKTDIIRLK